MRRLNSTICCLLLLVFGVHSEAAHVHSSSDHHREARGLHLDHAHLMGAADDGRHHRHDEHSHEEEPASGNGGFDARHFDHHDGDEVYVGVELLRVPASKVRPAPAIVSFAALVDPPTLVSSALEGRTTEPRAPLRKAPPGLRAPPA